jgi:hypothetical protein
MKERTSLLTTTGAGGNRTLRHQQGTLAADRSPSCAERRLEVSRRSNIPYPLCSPRDSAVVRAAAKHRKQWDGHSHPNGTKCAKVEVL